MVTFHSYVSLPEGKAYQPPSNSIKSPFFLVKSPLSIWTPRSSTDLPSRLWAVKPCGDIGLHEVVESQAIHQKPRAAGNTNS